MFQIRNVVGPQNFKSYLEIKIKVWVIFKLKEKMIFDYYYYYKFKVQTLLRMSFAKIT
jgi:hypothetical protein